MNLFIKLYPISFVIICALLIISVVSKWYYLTVFLILFLLCMLYFFRTPLICLNDDTNMIVSPTYGYVKHISYDSESITVDVVLDVFDIHAQYIPYSGFIKNIQYIPGKFNLILKSSKYHKDNEHNIVTLHTKHGDIIITQYAGYLTRRILNFKYKYENVRKYEMYGFITFGSQVSITLPSSVKLLIQEGDYLYGPFTNLATIMK